MSDSDVPVADSVGSVVAAAAAAAAHCSSPHSCFSPTAHFPHLLLPGARPLELSYSMESFTTASPISPESDSSVFSFETQASFTAESGSSFGMLDEIWDSISQTTLTSTPASPSPRLPQPTQPGGADEEVGSEGGGSHVTRAGVGQVLPSQLGLDDNVERRFSVIGEVSLGIQPDEDDMTLTVCVMTCRLLGSGEASSRTSPVLNLHRKRSFSYSGASSSSSSCSQQHHVTSGDVIVKRKRYHSPAGAARRKVWIVTVRYMEGREDKKVKRRASRKCKTGESPTFNELFSFKLSHTAGVLEVILWTESRFLTQRKKVGVAYVSLDKIDFNSYPNHEVTSSYRLLKRL